MKLSNYCEVCTYISGFFCYIGLWFEVLLFFLRHIWFSGFGC